MAQPKSLEELNHQVGIDFPRWQTDFDLNPDYKNIFSSNKPLFGSNKPNILSITPALKQPDSEFPDYSEIIKPLGSPIYHKYSIPELPDYSDKWKK